MGPRKSQLGSAIAEYGILIRGIVYGARRHFGPFDETPHKQYRVRVARWLRAAVVRL